MNEKNEKLLKALVEVNGIPGHEERVAQLMKNELKELVDDFVYDNIGSVAGMKRGSGKAKLLLAAHLDEVGFIVKQINKSGFIEVHPLGGWWPHVLLGQRMRVTTREGKEIVGVFGGKAPHGMSNEERAKVVELKTLFLDIGTNSDEETCGLGINPGDMITPDSSYLRHNKRVMAKALDDRIGIYIILEVARLLKGKKVFPDIFFAGTAQEEVGLRGAKTLSYKIAPDVAIALDVTVSNDFPSNSPDSGSRLGCGVVLTLVDVGTIASKSLVKQLETIARQHQIPFVYGLQTAGRTDAGEIHKSGSGVASITLSIPSRYIHSHNSIIDLDDVDAMIKLVTEFILSFNQKMLNELTYGKIIE